MKPLPREQSTKKETILALDTSTAMMTLCVLQDGNVLGERNSEAYRNHSVNMIPAMRDLLQSARLHPADLNVIAAGYGPGSYTGVRIGVTAAKTMAWALDIPLIGISSLEALAYGMKDRVGTDTHCWIVPLMDARRGQVYTSLFSLKNGYWKREEKDGIRPLHNWTDHLSQQLKRAGEEPERIIFTGESEPFREHLLLARENMQCEVQMISHSLRAVDLARMARPLWRDNKTDDIHSFEPNYTQLAEAESKWLAKQHK